LKINGNELKVGNIIRHEGRLWKVAKTEHVKPGKGGAYMQAELKCLKQGTKLNHRFRSSETLERARVEEAPYQFLFQEGDILHFMHQETFEQVSLPKAVLGEGAAFLQESMVVSLAFCEGEAIDARLPKTLILEITEADPVVKGQTAAASFKPAVLENGHKIMVPPHVGVGTKVVINTDDYSYVERAKS